MNSHKNESFIHKHVILDALEEEARKVGIATSREFSVDLPNGTGWIDLVLKDDFKRLAIEAELSNKTQRIKADIEKAVLSNATQLVIVVPNYKVVAKVLTTVDRTLITLGHNNPIRIHVMVLPRALKHIRLSFTTSRWESTTYHLLPKP